MSDVESIVKEALEQFSRAGAPAELEQVKARFLGRSGALTEALKGLSRLGTGERRAAGALLNAAKERIESALEARRRALAESATEARLREEALDVTLPGRGRGRGGIHPISRTWERIEEIFASVGFDIADGPEIETDWYNFTALNQPENHPARSMHDTFYIEGMHALGADGRSEPLLLRTHTSPMQVRYARMHEAPIRVIAPGRTYRVDSDATHSPMFHQVEGLWIDEDISFADLKGAYTDFLRRFFETDALQVRFRPSFFPFTEPSAEIDMMFASGPKRGQWLEISGAGQVHPDVVRNFGLDPERSMGFAFGTGLERLAMLRYGITDLRLFFDGDLRFLSQFD
ncbi:MAG: phenylalanine--tRNA ligase subunit alpha [Burkholderiales bacterium]|nr:phenylalanine--tRNA ligase subunit alpha [Burkholderiales bacterium]